MSRIEVFTEHESEVRSYCRSFPRIFDRARGACLTDQAGNDYIDFLSGAGTLNYGHNERSIKAEVMRYLEREGVVHALDFHTTAKLEFIELFVSVILEPRGLRYKLQFTGPTGTNAVEAALRLARKVTGRTNVISFTNAYHGMSLGSLAATAHPLARSSAGVTLAGVTVMPFDGYLQPGESTIPQIERMLEPGSGIEAPAAFIVETVQGEGGLNCASAEWLRDLQRVAHRHGALLIVDDIQAGCGRTGTFFSFEGAAIRPDVVVLSKSLSGLGLPMSLVLIRPDLDAWLPGEHTGTFRGHNLAFVAAAAAIRLFWADDALAAGVQARSARVRHTLAELARLLPQGTTRVKGRGLMVGLELDEPGLAAAISRVGFEHGLIAETCGVNDQVLKLLPPINIAEHELELGLRRLTTAVHEVVAPQRVASSA